MKLSRTNQILLTAVFVPALIVGGGFSEASIANSVANRLQNESSTLIAQNTSTVRTGNFVKAEAPTTGTVKIVRENGQNYLEIDSAFSTTDQAPDLHVLLEPSATPPKSYTQMNGFVNLGKLQKVKGAQRYPIPSIVNVANVKSVVIWCRMANATIGYATLK